MTTVGKKRVSAKQMRQIPYLPRPRAWIERACMQEDWIERAGGPGHQSTPEGQARSAQSVGSIQGPPVTLVTVSTEESGNLDPKWIIRDLKLASNGVPIREIYFGLSERHNPNMSLLSPGNPFAEMILFWVLLLEKMSNMY